MRLKFWWRVFTTEGKRWSWSICWHLGADTLVALGDFLGVIQGTGLCEGSKPQCLVTVMLKHPEILSLYSIHYKYHLPHHSSPLGSPHVILWDTQASPWEKTGISLQPFHTSWTCQLCLVHLGAVLRQLQIRVCYRVHTPFQYFQSIACKYYVARTVSAQVSLYAAITVLEPVHYNL